MVSVSVMLAGSQARETVEGHNRGFQDLVFMSCEGSAAGEKAGPAALELLEEEVMVQHFLPAPSWGACRPLCPWTHRVSSTLWPSSLLVPWLGLSLDPLDPITVRSSTPLSSRHRSGPPLSCLF